MCLSLVTYLPIFSKFFLQNDGPFAIIIIMKTLIFLFFLETIAAGTNLGNVAMWKHYQSEKSDDDENCWKLQPPSAIEGMIEHIMV